MINESYQQNLDVPSCGDRRFNKKTEIYQRYDGTNWVDIITKSQYDDLMIVADTSKLTEDKNTEWFSFDESNQPPLLTTILVELEKPAYSTKFHTAFFTESVSFVGSNFVSSMPKIVRWCYIVDHEGNKII